MSRSANKKALEARRPGRPEGQTNLSEGILDAAEVLFAERGYAGTTLRQVAEQLDVNPAMVAYYFKNKDNLFREVVTRRGYAISAERMERLATLKARGGYDVRDLVAAFIEPAAALWSDAQGRAFLRLHARLHMEPAELSFELRRMVHNESTHAYANAFAELLPDAPLRKVYQRVTLLVGAYLYAFSGTSRLGELLVEGEETPMYDLLETTISFGTAGMYGPRP